MTDRLKVPKTMQPVFDRVASLIDAFCNQHLNEEYSQVSRELAAALVRKYGENRYPGVTGRE